MLCGARAIVSNFLDPRTISLLFRLKCLIECVWRYLFEARLCLHPLKHL